MYITLPIAFITNIRSCLVEIVCSMKNETILLTSFDLLDLIFLSINKQSRQKTILWDPYRIDLGLSLTALILLFGRKRSVGILKNMGSLVGLNIAPVLHADAIVDYHLVQIKSENELTSYLANEYQKYGLKSESHYLQLGIDEFCVRALDLKRSGLILGSLVENLKAITKQGFTSIEVLVSPDEVAPRLVTEILASNGVKFRRRVRRPNFTASILAMLCFLTRLISLVIRGMRFDSQKKVQEALIGRIAVEFVDWRCSMGRATEPNFLVTCGVGAEKIIAYARSSKIARNKEKFSLREPIPVVFLNELPVSFSCLKTFMTTSISLIKNVASNRCTLRRFLIDMRDLINWIEFNSFMACYRPKVHVYNSLPNGRASTRLDSGIYTGVCRNAGCLSVSYQSRVLYRKKLYYYFEVFDKFYYWGDAWKNAYSYPQFIKERISLGYLCESQTEDVFSPSAPASHRPRRQVSVFLADMETQHPQHYTFNYTITFLTEVFKAVSSFNQCNESKYSLLIKPKDPEHWQNIVKSGVLANYLDDESLCIEAQLDSRHSIGDTLAEARKVISIGFTSPGLEALALGIPSIYFTPYRGIYNEVFDNSFSTLVARSFVDIYRFLESELLPDPDFVFPIVGCGLDSTRRAFGRRLLEALQ